MRNHQQTFLLVALLGLPLMGVQGGGCTSKCSTDEACDDFRFCNGAERCAPSDARADVLGCVAGEPIACSAGNGCSNLASACLPLCSATVTTGCAVPRCANDVDCSDHVFCNGVERCQPGDPSANDRGCVGPAGGACVAGQTCDESAARCTTTCPHSPDADGDGHRSADCGGDDCDDSDANRFPGNTEVCDATRHDEDCDPNTFGSRDIDNDGYVERACCNTVLGQADRCGNDCDDARSSVHPDQAEVCNGIDDNCNGQVDEGVSVTLYRDADLDGFGAGTGTARCPGAAGFSTLNNDCDDTNPALFPGQQICEPATSASNFAECQSDGGYASSKCPLSGTCRPQPNGTGICL